MSVSGIQSSHAALSAKYIPSARGAEAKFKLNAANALSQDTVELSAAALKKITTAKSLASLAQPGAADAQGGAPSDVYSRADVTTLLDQWGAAEPGSEYDFNQDGVIDAQDLASLLAKLGQSKPERSADAEEADPVYTRGDIQGLYDAWNNGSDPSRGVNERYDFDGDGRVDATDLAELLARLSTG